MYFHRVNLFKKSTSSPQSGKNVSALDTLMRKPTPGVGTSSLTTKDALYSLTISLFWKPLGPAHKNQGGTCAPAVRLRIAALSRASRPPPLPTPLPMPLLPPLPLPPRSASLADVEAAGALPLLDAPPLRCGAAGRLPVDKTFGHAGTACTQHSH